VGYLPSADVAPLNHLPSQPFYTLNFALQIQIFFYNFPKLYKRKLNYKEGTKPNPQRTLT
jgi:hypothetical protein